jgi:hypothetical protein
MLTMAVSLLDLPKPWDVGKEISHFILVDLVFVFVFLDYVAKPNEACDLHQRLLEGDVYA